MSQAPLDSEPAASSRTDAARRHFYQVWTLIGAALVLYGFGYVLDVLATPVAIIVWTVVIVLCLRSPVDALERRGVGRGLGTTIAYLGMFALVAALVAAMSSPAVGLGGQVTDMISALPSYVQGLVGWVTHVYEEYAFVLQSDTVAEWIDSASAALADWASGMARQSASGVVLFGTGIANALMVIGFALVVAFWILMELPALDREIDRLVPPSRKDEVDMMRLTFTRVMGGYLKATLLQCLIIGVACGVCFAAIGIPNAAALGLICGVLNIIPVVGPWIGGAAAAVVALFAGPFTALLALVLTIVIQQFVYTFVSPKLMSNSVDVHPALVIVALFVGSAVGGAMQGLVGSVVGMLLSIPFAAILKTMFVFYFERRTGRQAVSVDGVLFKGSPSHLDEERTQPDAVADACAPAVRKPPAPPAFLRKPFAVGGMPVVPDDSSVAPSASGPSEPADAASAPSEPRAAESAASSASAGSSAAKPGGEPAADEAARADVSPEPPESASPASNSAESEDLPPR